MRPPARILRPVNAAPGGFFGPIEMVPPDRLAEHQALHAERLRRYERQHGPEDGGPDAGVREPRKPMPAPPSLAAEREG